jgi:hypothetical protein
MGVAGEVHLDALGRMPELVKSRVEVEVNAQRHVCGQRLIRQHTGNVNQDIDTTCQFAKSIIGDPDRLP